MTNGSAPLPGKSGPARFQPRERGLGNISASVYLRLFGATAIVYFHAAPGGPFRSIGGIGLAILMYFSFLHAGRRDGHRATLKRLGIRLLVPWIGWWLIYAAADFRLSRGIPSKLATASSFWDLLAWPAIHLWYLPFVFVLTCCVLLASRIGAAMPMQWKGALTLIVGIVPLTLLVSLERMPDPLPQMLSALPAVGLGLTYGFCLRLESPQLRERSFVILAALVALACIPAWLYGYHIIALAYTGASILMILCTLPLPRNRLAMRLSPLTLGIYLAHPLAMMVLTKFFGNGWPYWIFAPATLILAALITWTMRRTPYLRALV